jgi:hypothetical protein
MLKNLLTFNSIEPNHKNLFDHRTNPRAHRTSLRL